MRLEWDAERKSLDIYDARGWLIGSIVVPEPPPFESPPFEPIPPASPRADAFAFLPVYHPPQPGDYRVLCAVCEHWVPRSEAVVREALDEAGYIQLVCRNCLEQQQADALEDRRAES